MGPPEKAIREGCGEIGPVWYILGHPLGGEVHHTTRKEVPPVPRALWKGKVVAESTVCQEVEGNLYFPPDTVKMELLRESETHTVCPWKGTASYYDIVVDGAVNRDAAWYYPDPKEAAKHITDHVAFWRGVTIEG
jgi:uncharacterized protein (DUF427 family)